MHIDKGHLDHIYEVLADKIHKDEVVSSFVVKFSLATNFKYKDGERPSYSNIYYSLPATGQSLKVIELSDVSTDSQFLDTVIKDVEDLIKRAREERKVLDSYLSKIRNL